MTDVGFMIMWYDTDIYLYKCKKLWFIHELTAHDTSKTAKITKKVITHQHIA